MINTHHALASVATVARPWSTKRLFKALVALLRTVYGLFYSQVASVRSSPALRSTFRRLEKRRVFAVDAFFVAGALDIQISNVGETNANLLADGSDFFVDNNNNRTFELGETRGSIADLQSVHAFSNDSIGKFFWIGDFSLAPLAIPLGAGDIVRTEGLSEVHLQAPFNAGGNVSLSALNTIDFDASIFVQGNLSATVSPSGTILDGPNADIHISGDAVLQSQNSILLGDEATASWSVVGLSNLVSQNDVQLGLVGNWDSANIRAIGNYITIVDHNAVSIVEIQSLGDFELTALGNITDQSGSRINVGGSASIQGASIDLANDASDVLHVSGGVSLIATSGQITVESPGTVTLGNFSASGTSVTLFEDADTALASIQTPGPFSAISTGSITDIAGANVQAAAMSLNAAGSILLADNANDTLRVSGIAELTSVSGSIELGRNGTVELSDVHFHATSGNIAVGGAGHTELGVIEARGGDVAIQEDTDMVVRAAIASNRLILSSALSLTNTIAFVHNGTQGISARDLTIEAGTFAHLGPISVDRITATVRANGTLNNSGLFVLNAQADRNGQSYLDAVGENLPPGVSSVDHLLSGESLGELRSRASFIQSFGQEYGLFVQNNKELTVEGIQATGDGIRVLIETALGTDLIVAGAVTQRFTQNDPGGVVLIAGEDLILNAGSELRIEHVSQDLASSRVIQQPNLIANAFDGGKGPAGYESTRDVLYAADAFADTGIQNVLQRVSTQFGVRGESGFQTLIRYADGSSQLFDANQELAISLQSNPSANSRSGVIPAFVSSAGDAAVVERATPFSDTFLGTFQTLPTTAIFRRSAEFFLFEHAGAMDASVTKVDLTPVVDLVDHVLSPGRKISFSLPTEIIVTPAILVAPIRIAPSSPNSFPSVSSDLEPSVLGDAKFEVFIVNVGFDDSNRDGQPSDPELPSRNEVQIDAIVSKSKSTDSSDHKNEEAAPKRAHLAPGEPNSLTKEIKSSKSPTAADINSWIEEYRNDPTKPSGAYAVISVDSVTGAKVLRVFGVRDFEVVNPEPSQENDSFEKLEMEPEDKSPKLPDDKLPDDNDKTTSADQQDTNPAVVLLNSPRMDDMKELVLGFAAGTFFTVSDYTVSKDGGNRFGRLARSQRAMRRIQAESQNDPVS